MKRVRLPALLVLIPAALALIPSLSSCLSCREKRLREFRSATLVGMVYDQDQKPCAGAWITVDGGQGPQTDINGRFVIDALERGDHRIGVGKEGFESLETQVSFVDRTQVLYLRVISFNQLLRQAEEALDRRKLQEADGLLRRAEALNSEDPVGLYLRAVYFLRLEDTEQAIGLLQKILARGQRLPAILLTLADIYQYRLKDAAQAADYLRQYLRAEDDPDIRARLAELEGRAAQ
jgi:tetratricopeptide (TPR) repeat protein